MLKPTLTKQVAADWNLDSKKSGLNLLAVLNAVLNVTGPESELKRYGYITSHSHIKYVNRFAVKKIWIPWKFMWSSYLQQDSLPFPLRTAGCCRLLHQNLKFSLSLCWNWKASPVSFPFFWEVLSLELLTPLTCVRQYRRSTRLNCYYDMLQYSIQYHTEVLHLTQIYCTI